jgi:hypothetical protein
MARTPRATVSKTSGQGTSRLAYQKTRSLTKGADVPSVKGPGKLDMSAPRSYGKSGPVGTDPSGKMNVSYGDTFDPTDLADIAVDNPKKAPKNPPRGLNLMGSPKGKKFK